MQRFIHINGPPGIGKSTLAQVYVDHHPGTLNLDIDRLRSLIGGWQNRFAETGQIVRRVAHSMAQTHLRADHDVVMPQYIGKLSELDRFEALARDSGAVFCEVVLMDGKERSIQRFTRRGENDDRPWHRHVMDIVERDGGTAVIDRNAPPSFHRSDRSGGSGSSYSVPVAFDRITVDPGRMGGLP